MGNEKSRWTIPELVEEAGRRGRSVTPSYLRRLCREGEIRAQKIGRDWVVGYFEAQRWLEQWLSNNESG